MNRNVQYDHFLFPSIENEVKELKKQALVSYLWGLWFHQIHLIDHIFCLGFNTFAEITTKERGRRHLHLNGYINMVFIAKLKLELFGDAHRIVNVVHPQQQKLSWVSKWLMWWIQIILAARHFRKIERNFAVKKLWLKIRDGIFAQMLSNSSAFQSNKAPNNVTDHGKFINITHKMHIILACDSTKMFKLSAKMIYDDSDFNKFGFY